MAVYTLDCLRQLCEAHDWYYNFSDDHRVYTKGNVEIKTIREAMIYLQETGQGRQAKAIYENWKPEGINFG